VVEANPEIADPFFMKRRGRGGGIRKKTEKKKIASKARPDSHQETIHIIEI